MPAAVTDCADPKLEVFVNSDALTVKQVKLETDPDDDVRFSARRWR